MRADELGPHPTTAQLDARLITAQAELLDHSGHVWPHLRATERRRLVAEVADLRRRLGFAPLDMRGRG